MPARNETITQDDFGRLVAYLQRQGLSQSRRIRAIGTGPDGRTVRTIAENMRAEFRRSPKAR